MVDVDHNCVPFSTCVPPIGGNVALLNVLPAGDSGGGGGGRKGFPPSSTPSPQPSYMSEFMFSAESEQFSHNSCFPVLQLAKK